MLCPICTKEKERKDFKRLATLSQTKAWLRNPLASKRMTYIGKECNDCHKQTKRKYKDLTPVELQKRLINQGVNPIKIEATLARRKVLTTKKKSAVARRTLRARYALTGVKKIS
jgi:hypothetical protein